MDEVDFAVMLPVYG